MTGRTNPTHAEGNDAILRELAGMRQSSEAQLEGIRDRVDGVKDRIEAIDGRMGRVERDLAAGERDNNSIRNEVAEVRRDMAELRDLVVLRAEDIKSTTASSVNTAAVTGAAQGSAEGTAKAFAPFKPYLAGGGLLVGLMVIVDFLANGEKLLRFMFGLFHIQPGGGD